MLPCYQFIIAIAVIISAAMAGCYLIIMLGQPAVAGEVLAGLLLGPSVLIFFAYLSSPMPIREIPSFILPN